MVTLELYAAKSFPIMYNAEPSLRDSESSKTHSLISPRSPSHMMDPPLPLLGATPELSVLLPQALLPVKLEYSTIPLVPSQKMDPPEAPAVLFTNPQFDTRPSSAPA